jgi:hypothetical protein
MIHKKNDGTVKMTRQRASKTYRLARTRRSRLLTNCWGN